MHKTTFLIALCTPLITPIATQAGLALTTIADGSTAVPGSPGNTFKDIGQPFLHNGQVLFYALNNSNAPGLYLYDRSAIQKIADTNTAAPNGGRFTNISPIAYGLENGAAAFVADDDNGPALFYWSNGLTTRLVKRGDAIPGTATNRFTTFGQPAFDHGALYFIGADSTNYRGVHRFDGTLSPGLFSSMETYPATSLPHGFSSQLSVEGARFAVWSFASNNQPNALFTWSDGVRSFLVSSNDAIPGAGVNFYTFQSPPDLQGGMVAFKGGSLANFQEGIFLRPFSGGNIVPVVRRGDPHLGLSGTLTSFNEMAIEDGQVWFHAGGTGGESLFLWRSNQYSRVLSSGMKLGTRTISSAGGFTFNQNCYHQDQAAFVVRFTDTTKALCLTTNQPSAEASFTFARIAGTNTPIPGGTGSFASLSSALLWQGGAVFTGNGTGGQAGLYRYSNGNLSVLLKNSDTFPGTSSTLTFFQVLAADVSRLALYLGGSGGELGLFLYDGTRLTLVGDMNTPIPGGGLGNFVGFTRAKFNGSTLTFLGAGTNNYSGVFEFNSGGFTKLVDSTSQFPGGTSFLRVTDFARQDGLLGLVAFDGAGTALQGLLTYTSGSFTLIATNGGAMPGRPNRVYGYVNGLGFSGGELVFTAQALSTVDSFSGTYLLKLPAGGTSPVVMVDENLAFPGIVGNASVSGFFIEPDGLYLNVANGSQRGIYKMGSAFPELLYVNNAPLEGASIFSFTLNAGGIAASGGVITASTTRGPMLLFAQPPTAISGGRMLPGSLVYSPGGIFCLTLADGTLGETYRLQYNETLGSTNWITFTNFIYTAPLTVCDISATNQVRVYRAVSP